MSTPAEQKVKLRQKKSITVNLVIASLIIGFSIISTFVEFEALSSKLIMASLIIAASFVCCFLLIRWFKSLDEYEYQLNAKAALILLLD